MSDAPQIETQLDKIEQRVKNIEEDLNGSATQSGVFENLRQLTRLVKISIAVSFLGGTLTGAKAVNWEMLLKILGS